MKTVCEYNQCAGCMACINICAKGAITITDGISAYNAVIDEKKCINCSACYNVCQANRLPVLKSPVYWWQGWAENKEIREYASSGGIATAIEMDFIRRGGCVCSCIFNNGEFKFSFADDLEAVKKFTGSKYVKSNPVEVYKEIRNRLLKGRRVLFVGLPCQVAAVKKFIGECFEELFYTIDLICHGTPSPQILKKFFEQYDTELHEINNIEFREKANYQVKKDGKKIEVSEVLDKYSIAFLKAVCFTENCYECKYARIERVSDITLGDSWGSELSVEEQKKGVSLILCQSEKGEKLLKNAEVHLEQVNIENAIKSNHQLSKPSIKPHCRDMFFARLDKREQFNKIVIKCYPKSCFMQFIKKISKIVKNQ